jgi:hypothetical protein
MNAMRIPWSGIVVAAAVACILLAGLVLPKPKAQKPHLVDGERMVKAFAQYVKDASKRREPPPSSITLDALLQLGYLTSEDVKPFEGAKVTFYAGADETRPQSVLCAAQMPDGTVQAVLADGSVQQLTRSRWQDYLTNLGQPDGAANRSQPIRSDTNQPEQVSVLTIDTSRPSW